MDWLVDETHISDTQISTSVRTMKVSGTRGKPGPPLAVRLHDVIVHNNKKWIDIFAGADIRVDIVAVQGNGLSGDAHSFYTPTTMRFSGVGDEDHLPIDESGLLAYYGWPKHFLNLAVLVSRDRKGSDDLATMLRKEFTSTDFGSAAAALLGLVVAAPAAGVVVGALAAAATIGDIAHRVVAGAFGSTIGIYRGTKLAYPDDFGRGRNPSDGDTYRRGDFSFWFEVIDAGPPNT